MGFNLIKWNPMSCSYFFGGSNLEKYGKFWKNGCFSGRIWPDWGNTTWADLTIQMLPIVTNNAMPTSFNFFL